MHRSRDETCAIQTVFGIYQGKHIQRYCIERSVELNVNQVILFPWRWILRPSKLHTVAVVIVLFHHLSLLYQWKFGFRPAWFEILSRSMWRLVVQCSNWTFCSQRCLQILFFCIISASVGFNTREGSNYAISQYSVRQFLKNYGAKKFSAISSTGYVDLSTNIEIYLEDKTFFRLQEMPGCVRCVTI